MNIEYQNGKVNTQIEKADLDINSYKTVALVAGAFAFLLIVLKGIVERII